jgi:hypothetical protein
MSGKLSSYFKIGIVTASLIASPYFIGGNPLENKKTLERITEPKYEEIISSYNIGDRVPDFKNKYFIVSEHTRYIDGKSGARWGYTADEDDYPEFIVFHRGCTEDVDIMDKPFAFYKNGEYILHFDPNMDSIIDGKGYFSDKSLAENIPEC